MSVLECPHCFISIEIAAANCRIFRCGIYKETGLQVNPHLCKTECDKLGDSIWGCGKPFELVGDTLVICDYK